MSHDYDDGRHIEPKYYGYNDSILQPVSHFFIATNVKTHSPLHMTKTYYECIYSSVQ